MALYIDELRLTDVGLQAINDADNQGIHIRPVMVVAGDYTGTDPSTVPSTLLGAEVYRGPLSYVEVLSKNACRFSFRIPQSVPTGASGSSCTIGEFLVRQRVTRQSNNIFDDFFDGGTRTAAITGAAVALIDAMNTLLEKKKIKQDPLKGLVAAISVGIFQDEVLLDLCYEEDSNCQTDLNVVMTQAGEFIEIQGTAEDKPFTRVQCNAMLEMAEKGIQELVKKQQQALGW
jgi:hypothetical protein